MNSNCFVLNEWILEDLLFNNGPQAYRQSLALLERIVERCDRIAVLSGSPWAAKAFLLMKSADPEVRRASKLLHLSILADANKCELVSQREVRPLPADLESSVPRKDAYLVQTYLATGASAVVTTDRSLAKTLLTSSSIRIDVKTRDVFLEHYLSQ